MKPLAGVSTLVSSSKQNLFVMATLFTGIWCLLTVLLVPPIYFTNDDLMFNLLAAGVGVTDTPDAHLLFTSILIGKLLVGLYSLLPAIPWYPLYLTLSTWLACSALLYVLLLRMPAARAMGIYSLYMGLFGVVLFSRMQFTIVALHCGLAGLALLHHAWEQRSMLTRHQAMVTAAGFVMLTLAAAIRIHIVFWLAILSIPLVVDSYWRAETTGRSRLLLTGAICVMLWVAVHLGNYVAYQGNQEWREFQEINSLRSSFNDYRQVRYSDNLKPVFEAVGWDRLDFDMINEWFYADGKKYNAEILHRIVDKFPAWKQDVRWPNILGTMQWIQREPVAIVALGYIAWMLAAVGVQGRGKVIVLGMMVSTLLAIPILYVMAKSPPPYLLLPTMVFIAYWLLYWMRAPQENEPVSRWRRMPVSVAGGFLIAVAGIITYGAAIADSRDLSKKNEYLTRTIRPDTGSLKQIYVVWGNSIPPNIVPAYRWGEALRGVNMVWIGGSLHSPVTLRQLQRLNITNLYSAFYERDGVFLLNSKPSRERLLAEYALSRQGVRIDFHQVSSLGGLRLLKVTTVSGHAYTGVSR
jgi:hypothetical protein